MASPLAPELAKTPSGLSTAELSRSVEKKINRTPHFDKNDFDSHIESIELSPPQKLQNSLPIRGNQLPTQTHLRKGVRVVCSL